MPKSTQSSTPIAVPSSVPDVKPVGIVKSATKSEFKTLDELMMAEAGVKIDESLQTALAKVCVGLHSDAVLSALCILCL